VVALGAIILLGIAVTSYTEAGFQPCVTPRALATAEIAEIVDQ